MVGHAVGVVVGAAIGVAVLTMGLAVRVYVGDVVEAIGLKVDDVTGYVRDEMDREVRGDA